ncbi:amino acid permease [Escherichia coli]
MFRNAWSSVVPEKSRLLNCCVLVGLPAAASVINFVVLTSAASSANSGVFSTSRMYFSLAQEGVAPKAFAKLSKRAVPAKGLTFSCICLLGGVVMLYVNPSVIGAFTMITTVSAILLCSSGRLSFARTWFTANSVLICMRSRSTSATRQADVLGMYGDSFCSWSCC